MRNHKIAYNIINIVAILVTASIFISKYASNIRIFNEYTLASFLILSLTVVLVHFIKAFRLYLALYGKGLRVKEFVKTYCKVLPVSVILPYKIGEFFRMYCYGRLIGNLLSGIVIILFDRFMDTAALLTVIFLAWILNGGHPESIVYFLIIFLIFILIIYFVYPGVESFWTKYLLKSKATERKLGALKMLKRVNTVYDEIANVAKGRGAILYFMSLIAWGVEIGSLYVLGWISPASNDGQNIYQYLNSALGSNESEALNRFIVATVLLLILVYLVIKLKEVIFAKRNEK